MIIINKFHIIGFLVILTAILCQGCDNITTDTQKSTTHNFSGDVVNEMMPVAITEITDTKGSDDECCSKPGQAKECWDDDKVLDNVVTCKNNGDCMSGNCDPTSHLCTCTSSADCENSGACSDSGLCGPSWCNGYMICSCWGGCEWWSADDNYTPEDWANDKGLYCCEGDYPSGPNASGDTIFGYLSNNPLCGKNCANDSDCNYFDDECTEGVCDSGGTCVPSYLAAGTTCGDNHPSLECQNHDICDGSGNCVFDYESAGTPCTTIDPVFNTTDSSTSPYYPTSCYTGYCGEVSVNLTTLTNSFSANGNGRCEPGVIIAENDTCADLFTGGALDTSNDGYMGSFASDAPAFGEDSSDCATSDGCLTASGSTLCAQSNYYANGDDCDSIGSSNPDLVYAFRYETNSNNDMELYGYVISVEADFDAAVYVVKNIDSSADCPAGSAVNSNRCLLPYSDSPAPDPWEAQINTVGNDVTSQGCCNPSANSSCGYKWCTRDDWSYPSDPVPCRDDNHDGSTACTLYTSYPQGNMATTVVYPDGRTDDSAAPVTKNVLVFIDSADGSKGNFTITVERRKWDTSPIERANDDPRVYDVTNADAAGSVYLGNLKNTVNSRHATGGTTCGGFDCSAGWSGKTSCHTGTANQFWPNTEYFKIHIPSGSAAQTYCIQTDESITGSADLTLNVLNRQTNGSNKTIGPIFVGSGPVRYKDDFGCEHDNDGSNARLEITDAQPGALYLIGVSQNSEISAPCSGNCNYKLIVTAGSCPADEFFDASKYCAGPMADSPAEFKTTPNGNVPAVGVFKIGSGEPLSDTRAGVIVPDDNNCFKKNINGRSWSDRADFCYDQLWLIEKGPAFAGFSKITVTITVAGSTWPRAPGLNVLGCMNSNVGVSAPYHSTTARATILPSSGIASAGNWPIYIVVEGDRDADPWNYDVNVTWVP